MEEHARGQRCGHGSHRERLAFLATASSLTSVTFLSLVWRLLLIAGFAWVLVSSIRRPLCDYRARMGIPAAACLVLLAPIGSSLASPYTLLILSFLL
ncbi:hypothetical protein B0H10DRAFT_2075944 [Mycena sp. CBHHK59/15]|nr:hypothetical protein B0H10DRAFT_2075944 [Mycena sp. CBHHK59/15]